MPESQFETTPPTRLRLTSVDTALVALALVASAGGSLWLGQDLNFDLLSYHYYNGYAFVVGRLDRDIAPTGWHTYISPALDALFYLGMTALPARGFGVAFGVLHGLNVVLVYGLCLAVLAQEDPRRARVLAGMAALVSALGPNAVALLGTTMGNNVVSIPVLAALWVLLRPTADGRSTLDSDEWRVGRLLLAGALGGVAAGLRLTEAAAPLALGAVTAGFAARRGQLKRALGSGAALAAGGAAGFLVVNGSWSAQLWSRFGNPLFPFANQVFRSPWFASEFLRDRRWEARDVWDWLRPPVDLAAGRTERLLEIGARDGRYLVLLVLALACLAWAVAKRWPGPEPRLGDRGAFVLAFWLTSYVLWAAAFYYYRYMTTLEFLAPIAILVMLRLLVPERALIPVALAVSLVLVAWSRTESWGRGDWRRNWFGVELPALARQPGTLVLMTGAPTSFALPSFPRDARFAHLTAIREKGGSELFDRAVARAIAEHTGPLLLLSSFRVDKNAQDPATRRQRWVYNPEEDAGPVAERFGLELTDRCEDMRTRRGRLYVCEVRKASGVQQRP
jgi:hypothetical protein